MQEKRKMDPEQPPIDLLQYARLRTMLDSLETGALRYYMLAATEHERNVRFKYLKTELTPIIEIIWEQEKAEVCPDGYYSCDGYCVSYPCTG
jgi:hypothetical protein